MEDENGYGKRTKPLDIDWTMLFDSRYDDDLPTGVLVTAAKKSKVGGTGEGQQQLQKEDLELRKKTDKELTCGLRGTPNDSRILVKSCRTREKSSRKLSGGMKQKSNVGKSSIRRRVMMDAGIQYDLPVKVMKKDSRIVVNGLSTKSAPFKCPSPLSEDSDELITSSADKKGSHSGTSSPQGSVGDIPGSSSETNASQEDYLNKDEEAISVPEAKEQSKNEAIPENKKRVSGNLPTLLDDDVKNLFGNILEAINTFGDRVVAALERSRERVYSGDEIYAMVEEMSLESPLKERAYLWLMTREKATKSLFGAPLEKRKSLLIMMMTDSSYQ